ncbi:hypothetical protein HHI36_011913 [Cryptolaemus montrouzieri]|uniref:Thioredoxin domain-containing protein n=1 Tax=Cryptolaemus montrouzieri TaxID=559131 RepID=A0ABD2NCP9_9CUCU
MPSVLKDSPEFIEATSDAKLTVVHFSADWAEQCKQIDDLLDLLSKQEEYSNVKFAKCQAESLSEISLKYKIDAVPSVLLFRSGKQVDRIDGADPRTITDKIKKYNNAEPLEERLKKLINTSKVMLFMKGNRNQPRCGFSKQIIEILNNTGTSYETFDILTDEEVRQGLKTYSDWPTYPQLYINGELVGGLDIVKDLVTSGELSRMINA